MLAISTAIVWSLKPNYSLLSSYHTMNEGYLVLPIVRNSYPATAVMAKKILHPEKEEEKFILTLPPVQEIFPNKSFLDLYSDCSLAPHPVHRFKNSNQYLKEK